MAAYLADTNILLRFVDTKTAEHQRVAQALQQLLERGDAVYLAPQVVYEFWAVATRPVSVNGFGWDLARVRKEIEALTSDYALLPDTPEVYEAWLELVTRYRVAGKQVHDARLVAAMRAHGLERLLTLNTKDFERYAEAQAFHPDEVNA